MLFVMGGKLLYTWQGFDSVTHSCLVIPASPSPSAPDAAPGSSRPTRPANPTAKAQDLNEGDWCSEACLWAHWVHAGTMHAVEMSNLLAIDAEKFVSVTMKHTMIMQDASLYAQKFIKDLNASIHGHHDLSKTAEEIEKMCTETFSAEGVASSGIPRASSSFGQSRTLSRGFTDLHFPTDKVSSTLAFVKNVFVTSGSSLPFNRDPSPSSDADSSR